jgi:hypothetical protein
MLDRCELKGLWFDELCWMYEEKTPSYTDGDIVSFPALTYHAIPRSITNLPLCWNLECSSVRPPVTSLAAIPTAIPTPFQIEYTSLAFTM